MHFRDAVDDREPQTRAGSAARLIQPRERLQHARGVRGRNAGSAIEHRQAHASVAGSRFDLDFAPVPAMAQRVVDEVCQQTLHRQRLQPEPRHCGGPRDDAFAMALVALGYRVHEFVQIEFGQIAWFAGHAREVQELVDDGVDVFDVLHHAFLQTGIGLVVEHFHAQPYA